MSPSTSQPEERFAAIGDALGGQPDVTRSSDLPKSKRFGTSEELRVKNKIFAILTKGRLVVKLPKTRVNALIAADAGERFDPGHGRLMKEWVAVAPDADWLALAREAMEYVGSVERGDHVIGCDGRIGRKANTRFDPCAGPKLAERARDRHIRGRRGDAAIDPDRTQPEPPGDDDLPFKVIADHPGFVRPRVQRVEGKMIRPLVRFADANLAFDLNGREIGGQGEPLDLGALGHSRAIREQAEPKAPPRELGKSFDGSRKESDRGIAMIAVGVSDAASQVRAVIAQRGQRLPNDPGARRA